MHDEEPLIWTHGAHCEAWDLREGTVDGLTNNRRARHPQASHTYKAMVGEADTWTVGSGRPCRLQYGRLRLSPYSS